MVRMFTFIRKIGRRCSVFALILLVPPNAATRNSDSAALLLQARDDSHLRQRLEVRQQQDSYYWTDRKCVTIKLRASGNGRVERTVAVVNMGTSTDADSLRTLVESWTIPSEFTHTAGRWLSATFALDHRGDETVAVRALPPSVIQTLYEEPLRLWLDAIKVTDPLSSPDSFRGYLPYEWRQLPNMGHYLSELVQVPHPSFVSKSPNGTFVMFAESLAWGASTSDEARIRVYDGRTEQLIYSWLSSPAAVHAFGWVDDVTFVLAGVSAIRHPLHLTDPVLDAVVPTIWVGNPEQGWMQRYVGVPITPVQVPGLRKHLGTLLSTVYPGVSWDKIEVYPRYSFPY